MSRLSLLVTVAGTEPLLRTSWLQKEANYIHHTPPAKGSLAVGDVENARSKDSRSHLRYVC
jgi:hypothetical protein